MLVNYFFSVLTDSFVCSSVNVNLGYIYANVVITTKYSDNLPLSVALKHLVLCVRRRFLVEKWK